MNPNLVEPCYLVLRSDSGVDTVKIVVWTEEQAEGEVQRLNALNGDAVTHYHWVTSRALRRDRCIAAG